MGYSECLNGTRERTAPTATSRLSGEPNMTEPRGHAARLPAPSRPRKGPHERAPPTATVLCTALKRMPHPAAAASPEIETGPGH